VGIDADKSSADTQPAMSSGFDAAFAKVKELVADFWANEKFHLSPACSDESRAGQEQEARPDFIDKCGDLRKGLNLVINRYADQPSVP
jgi:hypothetical protein